MGAAGRAGRLGRAPRLEVLDRVHKVRQSHLILPPPRRRRRRPLSGCAQREQVHAKILWDRQCCWRTCEDMRIVGSSKLTKTLALNALVKRLGLASIRRRDVPSVHSNSNGGWIGRLPPSASAALRFCTISRLKSDYETIDYKIKTIETLKAPTSLFISAPSSAAAWYVKNFTVKAVSPAKLSLN